MNYQDKYLKYKAKYLKLKSQEISLTNLNMSGGGVKNQTKPTLYLFKAEWCPHCRDFKSTWDNLKSNMDSKVEFVMFDSEKNANEIQQYNIEGYPTLILKAS
jgi:thiol-disulfide isomerase/thioredoxin